MCISLLWAATAFAQQLAFPTAEGFGRFAKGGRGGKAYLINSLSGATGSGGSCNAGGCSGGTITFKDCVLDRFGVGARTCIFRVGGIIDWPCESCYVQMPPFLTIAGQTAPGDGIMLKDFQLEARDTHDIIVRHLRVRPSETMPNPTTGGAIETSGNRSAPIYTQDVIIDHSSMGWACDDTTGAYYATNVTYQWNIVSEGMRGSSTCGLSETSKIGIWSAIQSGMPNNGAVSLLHNYWANHGYRAMLFGSGEGQFVNNVLYNIATRGTYLYPHSNYGPVPARAEVVNCYFKPGPDSVAPYPRVQALGVGDQGVSDPAQVAASAVYVSGNIHPTLRPNNTYPETAILELTGSPQVPVSSVPLTSPTRPTIATQTSATQAVTDVLAKAGAYAVAGGTATVRRDMIDTRSINDFNAGTGIMNVDTVSQFCTGAACGYPTYNNGTPCTDTDGDGICDAWETAHGLNPANAADGPALAAGQPAGGYTNLEMFINELAGDVSPTAPVAVITAPTSGATYSTGTTPLTTLAGTATDDVGVTGVTWSCPTCTPTSGTATCATCGASATSVSWSVASIGLASGANVITVTASDGTQTGTATLTVTLTAQELVALYLFNGAATDTSGKANHLTLVASPTYTTGKVSQGLSLNGTTQWGTAADSVSLDLTGGFTIAAWVNPSATLSTSRAVLAKQYDYFLYANMVEICTTGVLVGFYDTTDVLHSVCDTTAAAASTWTHLAGTYDGATLRLYRNGTQVASTAATGTIRGQSDLLYVGASGYGESFPGVLDEVRVYNWALPQSQIAALPGLAASAPPSVAITQPTTAATYSTSITPLTPGLAGTATDDVGVTGVTWSCPACQVPTSGTATCATCGATATSVTWSVPTLNLTSGANAVTVTATDSDSQTATATLTVTYTPATAVPTVLRLVK